MIVYCDESSLSISIFARLVRTAASFSGCNSDGRAFSRISLSRSVLPARAAASTSCKRFQRASDISGESTGEAVVAAVAELAEAFRVAHPDVVPEAAGLLVPGHVDDEAGVGVFAENLGWRDFPFRDRASAALGIPVSFSHDVRGAGEAEHRLGAAAPFKDVVVMAIGTGIA